MIITVKRYLKRIEHYDNCEGCVFRETEGCVGGTYDSYHGMMRDPYCVILSDKEREMRFKDFVRSRQDKKSRIDKASIKQRELEEQKELKKKRLLEKRRANDRLCVDIDSQINILKSNLKQNRKFLKKLHMIIGMFTSLGEVENTLKEDYGIDLPIEQYPKKEKHLVLYTIEKNIEDDLEAIMALKKQRRLRIKENNKKLKEAR